MAVDDVDLEVGPAPAADELPRELLARALDVVGRRERRDEPAACVPEERQRSGVEPADPPVAVDEVGRHPDALEAVEDV